MYFKLRVKYNEFEQFNQSHLTAARRWGRCRTMLVRMVHFFYLLALKAGQSFPKGFLYAESESTT